MPANIATARARSFSGRSYRDHMSVFNGVDPNASSVGYAIELGSKAPNGLPTTGFTFSLFAPAASSTPGAGGFTLTMYLWNPVTQRWQSFQSLANVNYDELYVCYDIDGGALLFPSISNVAVALDIGFSWCEQ